MIYHMGCQDHLKRLHDYVSLCQFLQIDNLRMMAIKKKQSNLLEEITSIVWSCLIKQGFNFGHLGLGIIK